MLNSYPPLSNWVEKNSTHHRSIRSSGLDESSFSQVASNQLTPTNNKERPKKKKKEAQNDKNPVEIQDRQMGILSVDLYQIWFPSSIGLGGLDFGGRNPPLDSPSSKFESEDPSLILQSPDHLIFDSFPIGSLGWVKFGGSMDNLNANK